jgi:hypothetical protein
MRWSPEHSSGNLAAGIMIFADAASHRRHEPPGRRPILKMFDLSVQRSAPFAL